MAEVPLYKTVAVDKLTNLPAFESEQTAFTRPIIPGGPTFLTAKNALIGGGIAIGLYVAYTFLVPPPKKSASVSGLGWLFGLGRRRRRYRRR